MTRASSGAPTFPDARSAIRDPRANASHHVIGSGPRINSASLHASGVYVALSMRLIYPATPPIFPAAMTACVRLSTPSFMRMAETCA